jgi:hypothetical protein
MDRWSAAAFEAGWTLSDDAFGSGNVGSFIVNLLYPWTVCPRQIEGPYKPAAAASTANRAKRFIVLPVYAVKKCG